MLFVDGEDDYLVVPGAQTLLNALNLILDRICDCDFAGDLYRTILEGDVDPADPPNTCFSIVCYKAVLLCDPLDDLLQVLMFAYLPSCCRPHIAAQASGAAPTRS